MKADKQGSLARETNLFPNLLRDARDGSRYVIGYRSTNLLWPIIKNCRSEKSSVSFAYALIERAILLRLKKDPPTEQVRKLLDLFETAEGVNLRTLCKRLKNALKQVLAAIYVLVVPCGS
jgi:hypothetical protein